MQNDRDVAIAEERCVVRVPTVYVGAARGNRGVVTPRNRYREAVRVQPARDQREGNSGSTSRVVCQRVDRSRTVNAVALTNLQDQHRLAADNPTVRSQIAYSPPTYRVCRFQPAIAVAFECPAGSRTGVAQLRKAFETLSPMGRHYFPDWLGSKPGMMGDGWDTLYHTLGQEPLRYITHTWFQLLNLYRETCASGDRLSRP